MYEDLKKELHSATLKNVNLEKPIENLASQLDANEQHNRNECLLLHGSSGKWKEISSQSKDIFAKQVTEYMGITIQDNYIRRAHRLGKWKAYGKPYPIISQI